MRTCFGILALLALLAFAGCRNGDADPAGPESSSSAPLVNKKAVAVTGNGTDMPFDPKDRPGSVVVRRNYQFEDVPAPMGYKLRKDKVFSFQGSAFRFGDFTYEGHSSAPAVSGFYREMLPKEGWRMVASTLNNGVERLQYRKGDEYCDLVIRDNYEYTQVDVSVYDPRHLSARAAYMAQAGLTPNTPAGAAPAGAMSPAPTNEAYVVDSAGMTVLPVDTRPMVLREQPDGTLIYVPVG